MSEHIPEPWVVDARTGCYAIYQASENHNCLAGMDKQAIVYQSGRGEESQPSGYCYLTEEQLANARRIVACVNACVGMVDPAAEIAELRAEREELRAALARYVAEYGEWELSVTEIIGRRPETGVHLEQARAVLAMVKGE